MKLKIDKPHFDRIVSGEQTDYVCGTLDKGWEIFVSQLYGYSDSKGDRERIVGNILMGAPGMNKDLALTFVCGDTGIDTRVKVFFLSPDENETVRANLRKARLGLTIVWKAETTRRIGQEPVEKVQGEVVDENAAQTESDDADPHDHPGNTVHHAPAMRPKLVSTMGICRYCGQPVIIQAPEDADQEEENRIASEVCDCAGAAAERIRQSKRSAAKEWAENIFSGNALKAVEAAIDAVAKGELTYVSWKAGKTSFKARLNSDECIRISHTYTESDEEEF